jgi:NAD(P)-dependent dehydrogenase (short-subunit alcohol dehydrogenase family)
MKVQPGTRIVTLSSGVSHQGSIRFDNLQSERVYKPMFQAYAQSKLADLIFSQELQRRLTSIGSPIISTAAHPGYAVTNLQTGDLNFGITLMMKVMKPFFSQDAAQGALPTLFAATAPEAAAGGFYGPDGMGELKGFPKAVPLAKGALDMVTARRLWDESERLTSVSFGGLETTAGDRS